MSTRISINPTIKSAAEKKARKENLSLNTIVNVLLKDYVGGFFSIGTKPMVDENGFTLSGQLELDAALLEVKDKNNLKSFDNVNDFLKDLKK